MDSCLVFASIARLYIQLVQEALHLIHSSVRMHGSKVRLRIEVETLDVDLVHVHLVVVHYLVQVRDWLVSQRIDKLNALEVQLSDLLSLILLDQSVLFCLALDQIEVLFIAL